MLTIPLIVISVVTLSEYACEMTEHLDKYVGTPKYGYSRNMVFEMGYDYTHDSRYVQQEKVGINFNDLVNQDFLRTNLSEPKITTITGTVELKNLTKPTHPFSAAQRSLLSEGINDNRWDVKVNDRGHQFYGLYHGNDTFVTNRMRAHVLLWLINGIKDYLTIFDDESLIEDRFILEKELTDKTRYIIERLANRIKEDKFLFSDFEFQDYIPPIFVGGSFVCVTKNYLLVSLMGDGSVLLYDQGANRMNLVKDEEFHQKSSYFLSGNYRIGSPFVTVIPRRLIDSVEERRIKYVILESSSVGKLVTEEMIDEMIKSSQSNYIGEGILTQTLTEDIMQKAYHTWMGQDLHFKNQTADISLIVTELKD